jgi:hypothetical protein
MAQDEEQPIALTAAEASWEETSGYSSVESSREAYTVEGGPVVITSQVSPDIRWVPARSLQQAVNPLPAAVLAWDETSGYGAVETSRATTEILVAP